jgi:hypothetical protein
VWWFRLLQRNAFHEFMSNKFTTYHYAYI